MLTRRDKIIKITEELFPEFDINVYNHINLHSQAEIFFLNMSRMDNGSMQKVVAKFYGSWSRNEVCNAFKNFRIFKDGCRSKSVSCPEALHINVDEKLIIMSYIEGVSLKYRMQKMNKRDAESLLNAIDLSALALSEFHQVFEKSQNDTILLDNNYNNIRSSYEALLRNCNLNLKCKPFNDFHFGNIIVNNADSKVYLLDFDPKNLISSPHLDLASFKFYLELLNQHPIHRFKLSNKIDERNLFKRFLHEYCRKLNVYPNERDYSLINALFKEHVISLQNDLRRKEDFKSKITRVYLNNFFKKYSPNSGD